MLKVVETGRQEDGKTGRPEDRKTGSPEEGDVFRELKH